MNLLVVTIILFQELNMTSRAGGIGKEKLLRWRKVIRLSITKKGLKKLFL